MQMDVKQNDYLAQITPLNLRPHRDQLLTSSLVCFHCLHFNQIHFDNLKHQYFQK